ncbi:MAG: hypothetical protein NZ898_16775 [Myxococcota bacterium]|nr:hypothetical protein [Myxococcota bacterium]
MSKIPVQSVQPNAHSELAAPALDPELLALPAPPSARRILAVGLMVAVVLAATALLAMVRGDIRYFFEQAHPEELGHAVALDPKALVPNRHVRVVGTPMLSTAVRYRNPLTGARYELFALAGQRALFVQVPLDEQTERRLARAEFSGRLVTFGLMGGRLDAVRHYVAGALGVPVTPETFVLLADEPPRSAGWAVALGTLCVCVLVLNAWLAVRWFRPLRD